MLKRTKEQTGFIMSHIRSKNTSLERRFKAELDRRGLKKYTENDQDVFGKPDFTFKKPKIAVFCDSEFWHGYEWETEKYRIKTNSDFWYAKIERNRTRDVTVTDRLLADGWIVLRFWGKQIQTNVAACVDELEKLLATPKKKTPKTPKKLKPTKKP
ncbi:MAG: very short patch repair endonuclease [Deltaproteobacteria bacterium]|jgi:DNA mismatch endonuclease (patch repair protein)|nr:very short patch repair endonuclease [Deltaproteobacteria bacterium]